MTVYVVGHAPRTGPVKIGYTADLDDRLRSLRRGESCPLAVHQRFSSSRPASDLALLHSIEGDRGLERVLHLRLKPHRIQGEWFKLGSTPAEVIATVEAARSVSTQSLPGIEWSSYAERHKAIPALREDEIRRAERMAFADLLEARYRAAPNADQREALRGVLEIYRPDAWRSGKG